MDPLSITASIIAVVGLTGKIILYLNDVGNISKDKARLAKETANIQYLLTTLQYHIQESRPEDLWFKEVGKLAEGNGPIDQFRVAMEQLMTKVEPKSGLRKVGEMILWKLTEKDVEEILSRIERLKPIIQIAIQMDHFKLSQAINDNTTIIRNSIVDLTQGVKVIDQRQERQNHRTVLNWLSESDFAAQQTDYISKRQEGTGSWFLSSSEFDEWLHGPKRTLFCPGIPGAGKTMIAAIVTDYLWKAYQIDDIGVAYLFCDYNRREKQAADILVAAILEQLIQQRPSVSDSVHDLYGHHDKRGTRPSLDELSRSLRSVLSKYHRVFIIIDALDECTHDGGTRKTLLSEIRRLQGQMDVRLMVTSRPDTSITQLFEEDLRLEISASDEDVERYLEGRMLRASTTIFRKDDLRQMISKKIRKAVDGMFLLARLHMDSLMNKPTVKAIKTALEELSTGEDALNEAYKEAIKRIEGQPRELCDLAKDVISWVLCAKRPLTPIELQHALAVEPGQFWLDEDNISELDLILSICSGLVTFDEESGIIRFVHYTTHDYFEHIRPSWLPDVSTNIRLTCITYLSFDAFKSNKCRKVEEYEDRLRQSPFLKYAGEYWVGHAGRVEDKLKDVMLMFLCDKSLVGSAYQASFPTYYHSTWLADVTGLHLLAYWGLDDWLTYVLKSGIEPEPKDSYGRTPLSWAAEGGHKEVVQLLLSRDDVKADSKDPGGRTPLSWAAEQGCEEVVKLLLTQDFEVNIKDQGGRTPLSWAAERGHKEVVQLLLSQDDIKADSKDPGGRTPLSWTAEHGYKEVVQLLLSRDDVKADSKDQGGWTPLSWAAKGGHDEVVKLLLLTQDVEVNSKDYRGQTPLSWAAYYGHAEVVKLLLLTQDVEVNSKDNEGLTPFFWAARSGYYEVVKLLLLTQDVEVNLKDNKGLTPLSWAAYFEHAEVVKLLLLAQDVEVNSKDNEDRTPLSGAAYFGHAEVVKLLLLAQDVEVNSKDVDGRTSLALAAADGYAEVVKLLLVQDVEVNSKDNESRTPLSWAAYRGHAEVVKLLLTQDVEMNTEDVHGRTPLALAAGNGCAEVVKLLLTRVDVKVDSKDVNNETPLSYAAKRGRQEVVRILSEHISLRAKTQG